MQFYYQNKNLYYFYKILRLPYNIKIIGSGELPGKMLDLGLLKITAKFESNKKTKEHWTSDTFYNNHN